MSFNSKQRAAIKRWIDQAVPLKGIYFRSVEYRFMDPRDVLSGAGTRAYGGRFAAVGTRAVYLSATDSGASKEVTARKARLGGAAQITTDKYPRVVYAVAVSLKRTLDLSALGSSQTANAIRADLSRRGRFGRFDGSCPGTRNHGDTRVTISERRRRGRQSCRLSRQLQPQDAVTEKRTAGHRSGETNRRHT